MLKLNFTLIWLTFCFSLFSQDKPNIILIMCDDMGYSDIGCYGGEISTPHLDRLANEGMRFRQFYNNAKCTTTRSAITTGLYPTRSNPSLNLLDDSMVTVADSMNKAGYATILSGKWHLGSNKGHRPIDRGFKEFYGLMDGCSNFFDPSQPDPKFKGGRVRVFGHNDQLIKNFPENFYTTDAFTDHAVEHMKKNIEAKKPYFLHITYTAPHYPLHAKPEDIQKYKGRYKDGWEVLRHERYKRMIELGVIRESDKLSPLDPSVKDWSSRENKDWDEGLMEVYAAMIDSMDQNIGRVLKVLDETNTAENTLILFISDNGGCAETPGGDNNFTHIPGPKEYYTACGPGWANAQNTPFRKFKQYSHEGGIASPCVARWPKVITPNSWTDSVAHIMDFHPTFMEMAGLDPKKDIPSDKQAIDGESITSIFQGKNYTREKPLYFEWSGNRAVRDGDWKVAYLKQTKSWELFNIAEDRTELHDLSKKYPEKLNKMTAAWEKWAEQHGLNKINKKKKKKK